MDLPIGFIEMMKKQLVGEYDEFLNSYDNDIHRGIRVNTIKISVEEFLKITDFDLLPIPWTRDGFYINKDLRPAKHPHYFAGLFYIQEPSAMLPAELLEPSSEDIVLDLCAAPGGKTMQLAAMMDNDGVLIANDINTNRIKALIRNCELLGVKNITILNEQQSNIKNQLYRTFNKILIDAPCSGEGMFKKHDGAINAYEEYDIDSCVETQKSILSEIPDMLNGSGEIVYSTCTFNTYENEDMIKLLIDNYDFELMSLKTEYGFKDGIGLPGALRLYPHKINGEGHFAAKLKNNNEISDINFDTGVNSPPELLLEFMKENFNEVPEGYYEVIKDKVFLLPSKRLRISNLRVSKRGWYLGELKKNRFVPSHAFALGLSSRQVKNIINFNKGELNVIKYLKCETIKCDGSKGYNLICVDNYPIGWGKWNNGRLKNLYPPAWRLM